jgi:hypothetical protein
MAGKNSLSKHAISSGGLTKPSSTWRARTKVTLIDGLQGTTTKAQCILKARLPAIQQSSDLNVRIEKGRPSMKSFLSSFNIGSALP